MFRFRETITPIHLSCLSMVSLAIFSFAGIIGSGIITNALNLPDIGAISEPHLDVKKGLFVAVHISIIAPIIEEIINRKIILGYMLRHSINPIIAIIISSIIFGISHLNPIQIPFATLTGIILGITYWKTGSLIIPTIIHIANNTIYVCINNNVVNSKHIDMFIESVSVFNFAIICFILCGLSCWLFLKFTPSYSHNTGETDTQNQVAH